MSAQLLQALEQAAQQFRRLRHWTSLTLCWLVWAIAATAAALQPSGSIVPAGWGSLTAASALAAITGACCAIAARRSWRDPRRTARRIEARYPDLGTGLLAAVEENLAAPKGRLSFLQEEVTREVLNHRRTQDWDQTVPSWKLRIARASHAAALILLILTFAGFLGPAGPARDLMTSIVGKALGGSFDLKIEPGDVEIERGTPLLVVARFGGSVPADADLVLIDDKGQTRLRMSRSLEDPMFGARVDAVTGDLSYRVEFADGASRSHRVKTFDYPALKRADARLVFPGYASIEPKTIEDVRRITAVEGTELTLLCRLNKEVEAARLVDEQGGAVELVRDANDPPLVYRTTMTLQESRRFKAQLIDREGRANKVAAEIVVNVTKNKPPTIVMTQPSRDVRVSPVEELRLKAKVDDDFGVVRRGVSFAIAGQEPHEIAFADDPGKDKPVVKTALLDQVIEFEALKAVPDQLLSYFVWAEDFGPDGKVRRAEGDMFFAEVRHFEEIFRQGEAQANNSSQNEQEPRGGAGAARQAEQLAEIQKQIINATWSLIRRETAPSPSAKFADDVKTILDSQKSAIEQASAMGGMVQDAAAKGHLDQAVKLMRDAEARLSESAQGPSIPALKPALAAEQGAYQALLKLRAREFEVTRQNARRQRRGGGGGGGGASQRQLDQLALSNDENRYEERRSARSQTRDQREQEQSETRQVINRLRELAQRQNDLNDRLKELQAALEAANDPQAKAEMERQLKRLREQEEEVLRDTDELKERMEREENRERMAQAREQVEQSRENVRQASEALEQGQLSQALTQGARAGERLNNLREELRKEASNRFSEEMTEMRGQARRLDESQAKLSEQIDAAERGPQRSLRDNGERQQVRQGLQRQRQELGDLLERMQTTVQEAEETEPLLAKQLFDAVRETTEKAIPDALEETEKLNDLGLAEEAGKASQLAGEGLKQLRERVDKASESVLGDGTEALRRARDEVQNLGEQINREIAQGAGEPNPGGPRREGQEPGKSDRPGDPKKAADPKGQPNPGQGQGQGQEQGQGDSKKGQAPRQPGSLRGDRPNNGGGGGGSPREAGLDRVLEGLRDGAAGPITGEGFREWSDRMREVEELLEDPDLRAEAARIRDRVRGVRDDFKRHSKEPDWTKLRGLIAEPIVELRERIAEEVRRRESPDALVPIDRDPVPPQYSERVRRYYERLGTGTKDDAQAPGKRGR